jgi:uncharacterized protein
MIFALRLALLLCCSLVALDAQTRRPFVRASGDATISATPDVVFVTLSVTSQGSTAAEAADSNAASTTRVINALKQLVGAKGEVKTVGYSVFPVSRNVNGVAAVSHYQATNSLQVNSDDLNLGGRIIDTGAQAGASIVSGISFGLRDYAPARVQALKAATARAKANAEAIASGLSARIGSVVSVEESSSVRPVSAGDMRLAGGAGAGGVPTPIEAGLVTVYASVVLEADLN